LLSIPGMALPRPGFATSASRSTRSTRITTATLVTLAALTLGGAGIRAAVAQPGITLPLSPATPPSATPSYRRQVMIADGLAAGTMVGATAAGAWMFDPDDFHLPVMVGSLGFTSYVLTTPIIHMAHGNVGRGLISGTIRILAPAIVASTAVSVRGLEEDDDGYGGTFFAGMAAGAAAAIAIDLWLLVPEGATETSAPPRFTPVAAVAPAGGVFGVAGTW
jgi:hypothetical protein